MNDGTILLVEDNPDDEELTLDSLRTAGVGNPVDVVRTGPDAIDYLFAQGRFSHRDAKRLPAVVLLDIGLPKLSGLRVLERIRANERTRVLPVVILTSSDTEVDRLRSYELGVNSYVRKPVAFEEFGRAVAQLGLYWMLINNGPPEPRT